MPLMPKRVKYRKQSKGNRGGWATSGAELAYGEFGLKATTRGFLTDRKSTRLNSSHTDSSRMPSSA